MPQLTRSESDRAFWRIAVPAFFLMVVVNYFPVLWGEIPFPRDLVLVSKAYDSIERPERQRLAQLGDLVTMFYPFRSVMSQAAQAGTLPLWNPYIMAGSPFQANSQSALFYPPHAVYYILPLEIAWTASFALRVFLAAVFMYLFVRSIGASTAGSIVAGTIFAFCGFITEWQGQASGDAAIWLPLICYGIHRLNRDLNGTAMVIASFALAMPILAGHPETGAHSSLTAIGLALMLWMFPSTPDVRTFDRRFAARFVLTGMLALGFASIQMIPTLEWLNLLGPQYDLAWPVMDIHQGQGFFSRDILSDPSSAGIAVPEGASYAGMLGLLCASLAMLHRSRRYVLFFLVIASLATAVAFGIEPIRWVVTHLPFLKSLKNGRLTLVVDFAIAAMAGLGISVLADIGKGKHSASIRASLGLLFVTFAGALFCIYEVHLATPAPVEFWRSPWGSLVFLIAGLLLIVCAIFGRLHGKALAISVCVLAAIEMVSFSYGYFGFSTRPLYPAAPVFEFLRKQGDPTGFRVAKQDYPIPINSGILYGFDAADGYELSSERLRTFCSDLIEKRDDGLMFRTEGILSASDRRIDLLNIKYFVVDKPGESFDRMMASERFSPIFHDAGVAVFENKNVLPRVFLNSLDSIEVVADAQSQLERLRQSTFDPQKAVLFRTAPTGTRSLVPSTTDFKREVHISRRELNGFTLRTDASQASVAVISQVYYPGWKAMLDGQDVEVHPVNYALTGVVVPAGQHEIQFYFRPGALGIGAALSIMSLIVGLGLIIYGRRSV